MGDLQTTASMASAEAHVAPASHSPTPASEPEREPLTDHAAYLVGLTASQGGFDLAEVVFDAIASWPGTSREVCQAIASAALGWCVDQWRQDGGGDQP